MHKRTNMMYIMRKNKGLSFKLPVSKITFWINTDSIQYFHTHSGLLLLLSYILRIEHENKFYKKIQLTCTTMNIGCMKSSACPKVV